MSNLDIPWEGKMYRFLIALLGLFIFIAPVHADVIISEFVASNDFTLFDEDGDDEDWLELYNDGLNPVDLTGWHLTDDAAELDQWTFPAVTIDPNEYLVVFASKKDRTSPNLHTNFSLSAGGEYLALVMPDGVTIADEFSPEYPSQSTDISYGREGSLISAPVNIAVGGTTTQSSTASGGLPERAIDGNTNGVYNQNSVTHTSSESEAWWQLDLGEVKELSAIKVWNRTDCCMERLKNFHVLVSDLPFESTDLATTQLQTNVLDLFHQGPSDTSEFFQVNRTGRYIRVQIEGTDPLSLAELQVFDVPQARSTNLALSGTATQSSLFNNRFSSIAIDGNTDGNGEHLASHTQSDSEAWWQVDLGSVHDLSTISIWNRIDGNTSCCSSRLNNFHVFVSDTPFTSTDLATTQAQAGVLDLHFPGSANAVGKIDFDVNRSGRYVRVQLEGTNFLHLAEVQVFEKLPPPSNNIGFLEQATPGTLNSEAARPLVTFSQPNGVFTSNFSLTLDTERPLIAGEVIRYTMDNSEPTESSSLYTGPIPISDTTRIRARVFRDGKGGRITFGTYTELDSSVTSFNSNLPIVVIDTFNTGVSNTDHYTSAMITVIDVNGTRANITDAPNFSGYAGIRIRGSSSSGFPKKQYKVEIWDDNDDDFDVDVLGLGEESDWVLYAPGRYDRSMVANPLMYRLSGQLGMFETETRFVEVYLNDGTGPISSDDYDGLYVFQESKFKIGENHVDIEKMSAGDTTEPGVTGGYIVSIDRPDGDEYNFKTSRNVPNWGSLTVNVRRPKLEDINSEQINYIENYIQDFEDALYGPNPEDTTSGYPAYIDTLSWIDQHILRLLAKDPDTLRLSNFFYKDRGGKLSNGLVWDFDRTLNSADSRDNDPEEIWNCCDGVDPFGWDWWGQLFAGVEFEFQYRERWAQLRQDVLSEANIFAMIDGMEANISEAYIREDARWGSTSGYGPRYDGDTDGINDLHGEIVAMKDWITLRLAFLDNYWDYEVDAPIFDSTGGIVQSGFNLDISNPNDAVTSTIYYTTDSSDPRAYGGGVSLTAINGGDNTQVEILNNVTIKARVKSGDDWSPLEEASFIVDLPPVLTIPGDVTVEATGTLTPVSIGTATAVDDIDPSPVISNDAPAGGFPVGTTEVTWTATDNNGNSSSAIQNITVGDTTSPVVTAPANQTVSSLGETTFVDIGTATATDNVGVTSITNDAPSGNLFPVGTTIVTWTAEDAAGNTGTATQSITVEAGASAVTLEFQDGVFPNASYDGTRDAGLVETSPTTNFGTLVDLQVDGDAPDPFNPVLRGEKQTVLAWDLSEIPAGAVIQSASISLNVYNGSSGDFEFYEALTNWDEATTDWTDFDEASEVGSTLLGTLNSGPTGFNTYALNLDGVQLIQDWVDGTKTNNGFILQTAGTNDGIRFHSREVTGFSNRPLLSVTFNVPGGIDTESPVVTAPADETVTATGVTTFVDIGTATATDNVGVTSITNDAPSGNLFPVGTTIVTWTAEDAAGNTGTATQSITVEAGASAVTLEFQDGVFPNASYDGTRDAGLVETSPTMNFGTLVDLQVDGDAPDPFNPALRGEKQTVLAWDLSEIPAGAVIQSASISLNVYNGSSGDFEFYEALTNWDEATTDWTDFDEASEVGSTLQLSGPTGNTYALNLDGVQLIQDWVDGTKTGFILQTAGTNDGNFSEPTFALSMFQVELIQSLP